MDCAQRNVLARLLNEPSDGGAICNGAARRSVPTAVPTFALRGDECRLSASVGRSAGQGAVGGFGVRAPLSNFGRRTVASAPVFPHFCGLQHELRRLSWRADRKLPCKFPVCREMWADTGSLRTVHTTKISVGPIAPQCARCGEHQYRGDHVKACAGEHGIAQRFVAELCG